MIKKQITVDVQIFTDIKNSQSHENCLYADTTLLIAPIDIYTCGRLVVETPYN